MDKVLYDDLSIFLENKRLSCCHEDANQTKNMDNNGNAICHKNKENLERYLKEYLFH